MLMVVALVGIVATLAMPSYRHATLKARDAVLKENLWLMRDCIDQFYTDKGRYPDGLQELATEGYFRRVPVDPYTGTAETWIEIREPLGEGEEPEDEAAPQGVTDVQSGATGFTQDTPPVAFSEL
jgi:general secretion pathway protein G